MTIYKLQTQVGAVPDLHWDNVAGRFYTSSSNVSIGTSSDLGRLTVDNGAVAQAILTLRDNGSTVYSVIDGGAHASTVLRMSSRLPRTVVPIRTSSR
jgi:hypothetical protein